MSWLDIEIAPRNGTRILVSNVVDPSNEDIYITAWIEDVYTYQGGSGGPSGWFSGEYNDRWGDQPRFDRPKVWKPLT